MLGEIGCVATRPSNESAECSINQCEYREGGLVSPHSQLSRGKRGSLLINLHVLPLITHCNFLSIGEIGIKNEKKKNPFCFLYKLYYLTPKAKSENTFGF